MRTLPPDSYGSRLPNRPNWGWLHARSTELTIVMIALLGAALILVAYWPGVMIDDARWQYQQAVDNAYEDWHPPLMAWIWHKLIALVPGPGPMLVLQVALYWTGIALIALSAYKRGHPRLALALVFAGYLPASFALTGSVTKDALMEGALLIASAIAFWRPLISSVAAAAVLRAGAIAVLLFAAALRFNAFLACVPLALVVIPDRWTRTKPRLLLSSIAAGCIFLATGPAIASLLHAEDTDVKLSLIIFDLGGVTEHSGVTAFPDLKVRDPVAVNHRCYDPSGWDSYSDWANKPCPLGFDGFQALIDEGDTDATQVWLDAIAHHPVAYLEHRLTYFNLSTWFVVPNGPDFTAWSQSVSNPWGFKVKPNRMLTEIGEATDRAALTPIGWPIFWISVALAAFIAAMEAGLPREHAAIAASAFLYGIGYLAVGVATGIRYYTWTFSAAAIAALLVGSALPRVWPLLSRTVRVVLASVVVGPTLISIAARTFTT